ncbi:MAG: tRNA (adenosine(37)-N6)-threonylcarbamoyltransferase complex dimerization subunit type 1 TsaB [Ferruginibacter sp.]|nr:tRNA (adenosine(37)-N6)-threonylcarbamoyltransferase complex dimerization subunit type 1 TsaB [Ferruginibacter sp.]
MGLILNIDTASENAHISFAEDGKVLHTLSNGYQKDHASFLQAAIEQLVKSHDLKLKDIDAVAVTAGPGSYTGLRVGMASAKGLCYALKKPLITIGTLQVMTASALQLLAGDPETFLYCPMMDARRMEVFTAIYKYDFTVIMQPCAMILNESSFEKEISNHKIIFFGSGSAKWQSICRHSNAVFKTVGILPPAMSVLSDFLFLEKKFTDLAYSEPVYLKEFQTIVPG